MTPRLVAISGEHRESSIPLEAGIKVTIGRESSNPVHVSDQSVSRVHCAIESCESGYELRDLESRNGTFVNGVPVRQHQLKHGDQIEVGRSVFVYLEDDLDKTGPIERSQASVTRQIVTRPPDSEIMRAALTSRDLRTLLRISTAIHSVQALYAARESGAKQLLEQQLLDLMFESVPADRGAIVLVNDIAEMSSEIAGWSRTAGRNAVPIDRAIIDRVLAQGEATLVNDISDSPICCLMALPLTIADRVQGVIYLDCSTRGRRFTEEQMELMTAIASIAAMALENARYVEWLQGENQRLRGEIEVEHSMVGESPAIQQIFQFIARAAPTESTVLITGESGTGKELVARAIHQNSTRASKPFIAINCAAITDTLLESEFFGHEKGSFTGAVSQKKGKLEVADGGTVFLDEVGELAPALQAKLLRVLQERCFERVGGTRSIQINVRVMAATNRDLQTAIKEGRFRLDLYYRLNVVTITMPPLRERRPDIPLLARYFASRISKNLNRPVMGISPEARLALMHYEWPGNIRELENAIERAVVLGSSDLIRPEDLPESIAEAALSEGSPGSAGGKYQVAVHETRKQAILKAMEQSQGSVTEAARLLGVHPNYLHRLIRNLNLRPVLKRFA